MSDINWNQNVISINGKNIELDYDILEVRELNDMILVVTVPESDVLNNLYGISVETGKKWQAQALNEVYPEFSQTPYVGISIINNDVLVTDFCGCRFIVNPKDGKIIRKESEVR